MQNQSTAWAFVGKLAAAVAAVVAIVAILGASSGSGGRYDIVAVETSRKTETLGGEDLNLYDKTYYLLDRDTGKTWARGSWETPAGTLAGWIPDVRRD